MDRKSLDVSLRNRAVRTLANIAMTKEGADLIHDHAGLIIKIIDQMIGVKPNEEVEFRQTFCRCVR